jgi:hypothetical protein
MLILVLYTIILVLFSVVGTVIGYVANDFYPGSGSFVAVAVFLVACWLAWSVSVAIMDRFWPDPEDAPSPGSARGGVRNS